jgi:hypothetical protein
MSLAIPTRDHHARSPRRPALAISRAPTDINVNEPVEIDDWEERLGVSEHLLRQAVADAGSSAQAVAEHFGKR